MEVRFQYEAVAKCHPQDLWHVFANIEQWQSWCNAFGGAGWLRGEPWKEASRFFIHLKMPKPVDLEIVVLRCRPASEVVLLCHSENTTVQQWITFSQDVYGDTIVQSTEAFVGGNELEQPHLQQWVRLVNELWLEGLSSESQKYCATVAL